MKRRSRAVLLGATVCCLVAIDQAAKWLIFAYVSDTTIVPGILEIVKRKNPGLLLGFGSDTQALKLLLWPGMFAALVGIIYLFKYLKRRTGNEPLAYAYLTLSLAELIGNNLDRALYGYIRDYIGWFGPGIANLADIFGTIAILAFLVGSVSQIPSGMRQRRRRIGAAERHHSSG